MAFIPSQYQSGIFNWGMNNVGSGNGKNLIVDSVAGSGKTTTGVELVNLFPANVDIRFFAFGRDTANVLKDRLQGRGQTYHSLGLQTLRENIGFVKVDNKGEKIKGLLNSTLDKYTQWHLFYPTKKLVGLCKNTLISPTPDNLYDLALEHNIELVDKDTIFSAVDKILEKSTKVTNFVDFDDMIYLPVVLNLKPPQYDSILVDEVQDTNTTQLELAMKSVKSGGNIIGIGDKYQSIYGFRGANVNAIPDLISRLNADVLPLSITYRNPLAVVQYVNETFPHIKFEGRKNAPNGVLKAIDNPEFFYIVDIGDMILCRTNAPLVPKCFELIRRGIKATIKGRDIGENLVNLIKKFEKNADNLNDLLFSLEEYRQMEFSRLMMLDKRSQATLIDDKVNTILAVSDGCKTIDEVKSRLTTIFSDDINPVIFSSIHKAKGLESQRIFILEPHLLPHPMAKLEWEMQQEENMHYVAVTRSLQEMYFVGGMPIRNGGQ